MVCLLACSITFMHLLQATHSDVSRGVALSLVGAEAGVSSYARHSSIMIRPLERQASTLQGKRLSARALLGAFGPMCISAVMFDLQGKVDADQLQAAQVLPYLLNYHSTSFLYQTHRCCQ